ncbi:MAG: YitT family protein [Bacteroidales bacterium]|nr:YitT family protein [Bacteroidales bacterium]MBQ8855411.1 YitT family protein [Bacteroidales bacterium]
MKTSRFLTVFMDYLLMTVGSLIFCMAWTSFLIPNGLASGGLTGLCTIIQYGTGIPVGLTYPVINVVLLILGFLSLGKAFGFKTIYVIALTSLLFDLLPKFPQLEVMMDEKFLVALVGATLESIGIGLVLLRGGSTGGTDIIAMMINKYWPVSPGRVYLYTDLFIISCLLFVPDKGLVDLIYAFVVMLGFSFGVDFVLLGNKSSVQILVFSSKYQEIADHMINEVHRGVTALQSVGWYSQKESKVLLIIARKYQMNEVVNEIKRIDKQAFISVSTAMSVFGEGFEEVKTGLSMKKLKNKEDGDEQ